MNRIKFWITFALTLTLLSCSDEKGYSEHERTEVGFLDILNGDISPAQWWKTSVTINVQVHTYEPVKLMLMSDNAKGTLYDYKEVSQSGTYAMTAPQGKDNLLYLVCVSSKARNMATVVLSGKNSEAVTIDTSDMRNRSAAKMMDTRSKIFPGIMSVEGNDNYDPDVHPSLHTSSISGGVSHYEFGSHLRPEINEMVSLMRQNLDAKYDLGLNCDYELESNGPFNITWLAGYGASQAEHILGYFVHSRDTYDDIQFYDLAETHKYDIIDDFAKVQYQISEEAYYQHPNWGLQPNKWYDANFDMLDVIGSDNACNPLRVGDKAYNSMEMFILLGSGVSRIRGISFQINVEKGKRVGFYLKDNSQSAPEQWDLLNNLGIKGIGSRSAWKGRNFCVEAFNKGETHRSCIIPYEQSTWMGIEDRYDGGDYDCNDVMFGITSEVDIYRPTIITPDINLMVDTHDTMPWTIAYEDMSRDADFDFNDAVIKLTPDYKNETCTVTVEAAGATSRMYLHYDGPDGDVNLGEIHELLGGSAGSKINTQTSHIYMPFVDVRSVAWPKTYTMANDAKRFWIEIQRGTCKDCTDVITLAQEPGKAPEAILVAGEWNWPIEGVHILSAYSKFSGWAKDVNKTSYWNWYSNPRSGAVVSF